MMFNYIVKFMYNKFEFLDGCEALKFAEDIREHFIPEDDTDKKAQVEIFILNATTGASVEE